MCKIVSVVPIKLNNERLPGKNTKILGDKPLMEYIQTTLLNVKQIDEHYIFCSNDDVQPFVLPGFTFLRRPQELDKNTSNFTQIFQNFMSKVDADVYVYSHATAPFIKSSTISECIDAVLSGEYDSAFTAVKIQDFLWSDGQALNFDPAALPRSQDIKPIYRETSGVYVFTKNMFEALNRRVGNKPYIRSVDFKESIDINEPQDFELATMFAKLV